MSRRSTSARFLSTTAVSRAFVSCRASASRQTRDEYSSSRRCIRRSASVGATGNTTVRLAPAAPAPTRDRWNTRSGGLSDPTSPIRQSAANCCASPACGVAVSSTTRLARHAAACTAARRAVPRDAPCASSMTTMSQWTCSSGSSTSGRLMKSNDERYSPGSVHGFTSGGRSRQTQASHSASAVLASIENFSASSRDHCSRRPAGATTSPRKASSRASSARTRPAWTVFPRPTASAIITRTEPCRTIASAGSS